MLISSSLFITLFIKKKILIIIYFLLIFYFKNYYYISSIKFEIKNLYKKYFHLVIKQEKRLNIKLKIDSIYLYKLC